jgi:NADP-dependent 3-hydroxy acid dehydrogenase YdfG
MSHSDNGAPWLAAMQEMQRQTTEAHMHFQRVLAESHQAFLHMAENTFAALTGHPPTASPPSPSATPLPPAPAPPSFSPATYPPPPPVAYTPPPTPVAAAPPPPPPQAPAAEPVSLDLLLSVVADKTGYPVDMLNGGMDLETDLGIDSIKKVEIFAAVRERTEGLPPAESPQMSELFQARTLDQVIRGVAAEPPDDDDQSPSVVVRRLQVRPVETPASGAALPGLHDGPITVVDGGSGLAEAVVAQLETHGITATSTGPPTHGLILLGGLAPVSDAERATEAARRAFQAARLVAPGMTERGGVFVTVQDTGGRFDSGDGSDPRLGALAGLARTAAKEWPKAAVKTIDCRRAGRSPEAIATAIVTELLTGGSTLDVGLTADGCRWTLTEAEAPPAPAGLPFTGDSVLVVSGGARGVTAAGLLALAATASAKPRMLLLGRTELTDEPESLAQALDEPSLTSLLARPNGHGQTPAQLTAQARTILAAREVRATLAGLVQAGVTARYAAVDITDRSAVGRELARTRAEWGPITGLIQGAGVLADKRIDAKTDAQFERVFATKVAGLEALLAATADDPLDLLLLFSSVAARFGNEGQCDYAMANEVLNQVALAEQRRRPACRVRSLGWGPWAAGMVTAAHAAHFREAGVPLIPVEAGARAFVTELSTADGPAQVLLHAEEPRPGMTVDLWSHGYLADHAPAGVPVLPLAMAVEWFGGGALADVQVLKRIELPGLATGGHRFTVEGTPTGDLHLTSSDGVVHYRARPIASDQPPRSWPETSSEPLTEEGIYDSVVLFHGPAFQVVRGVHEQGTESRVAGLRAAGWPGDHWRTDPAAIDGALQTAVLWARRSTGRATLPMGVDEVRIHRPGPATTMLRCVLRATVPATTDESRCDVALIDEDGGVRAELLGVRLVRRPDVATA